MAEGLARLVGDARRHLEIERAFGVTAIPFDLDSVARLKRAAGSRGDAAPADKESALEMLRQEAEACRSCALGAQRRNLVFGAGDPDAEVMFIGEAPGRHEDEQGVPFVGPAGQLLTKIIEAMGLSRNLVYIANVLKCRPPGNRNPLPDEVVACFPHLKRQIEIIQPQIIVTLGNPATKAILETTQGITRMRGRFVSWHGIEVMPTFHPSYLLHNPSGKRDVWQDMQKVHARMKELGLRAGELKQTKR